MPTPNETNPLEGMTAETMVTEYQVIRNQLDTVARELGYADGFSGMLTRDEKCSHCGQQIKWTLLKQLWLGEEARLMTELAAMRGFNDPKVQAKAEWLAGRIFQVHACWAEPERIASAANVADKQKQRTFLSKRLEELGNWILELAGQGE